MNPTDISSCSPARSTTAARVTTAAKRGILAAITTVAATGLAMGAGGTALAAPIASPGPSLMSTKAGDGGLETKTCTASSPQVRIDSFDVPGTSACYELTAASGWVAINITGSYGVINNLTSDVSVAFKLPDGAVYWQATIAPGEVHSIDVNRGGSTVVELQVSPVSSPNGPSTGNLTPGPDAAGNDNVVSLRSAGNRVSGQVARINWNGVITSPLTRNSGFTDRLDGSFKVVRALDGSGCISLESAAYPDTYLHTTTGNGSNGVAASINPDPTAATWCATDAATPVTGKYLASAADQSRVLSPSAATNRALTTTTNRNAESAWFVDTALAFPGN